MGSGADGVKWPTVGRPQAGGLGLWGVSDQTRRSGRTGAAARDARGVGVWVCNFGRPQAGGFGLEPSQVERRRPSRPETRRDLTDGRRGNEGSPGRRRSDGRGRKTGGVRGARPPARVWARSPGFSWFGGFGLESAVRRRLPLRRWLPKQCAVIFGALRRQGVLGWSSGRPQAGGVVLQSWSPAGEGGPEQ